MQNLDGMNIMKMAEQIAKSIPDGDKQGMQNMNLEDLVSSVSGSVFQHMKNLEPGMFDGQETTLPDPPTKKKKKRKKKKRPPRTPDILQDVEVTLEELYSGCEKTVVVRRPNGDSMEKAKFSITVEPGMQHGKVFTFEGEAGTMPGSLSGDVHITLHELTHLIFERDEDDLIVHQEISISQLFDLNVNIPMLDGTILNVTLPEKKHLQVDSICRIDGKGMPIVIDVDSEDEAEIDLDENKQEFGDLYYRFNVLVDSVSTDDMESLKKMFPTPPPEGESDSKAIVEILNDEDIEDDEEDTGDDEECGSTDDGFGSSDVSDGEN